MHIAQLSSYFDERNALQGSSVFLFAFSRVGGNGSRADDGVRELRLVGVVCCSTDVVVISCEDERGGSKSLRGMGCKRMGRGVLCLCALALFCHSSRSASSHLTCSRKASRSCVFLLGASSMAACEAEKRVQG